MSRRFSELCTLLVQEFAGSLPAKVFETLAGCENLSLRQLVQVSKLVPRFAENALSLLLLRQLVIYSRSLDDSSTTYEAQLENAYSLIRAGKHCQLIETYFGSQASDVVQKLQERGFVCASEIRDIPQDVLEQLFRSKHIVLARHRDLRSDQTNDEIATEEFEKTLLPSRGPPTSTDKKLLQTRLEAERKHQRDANTCAYFEIFAGMINERMATVTDHGQTTKMNGTIQAEPQDGELTKINGHLAAANDDGNDKNNAEMDEEPTQKRKRKNKVSSLEILPELTTESQISSTNQNTRRTRNSIKTEEQTVAASKTHAPKSTRSSKRSAPELSEKENNEIAGETSKGSKRRKTNHESISDVEESGLSILQGNPSGNEATADTRKNQKSTQKATSDNPGLLNGLRSGLGQSDLRLLSSNINHDASSTDKGQTTLNLEATDPDEQSNEPILRLNLEKFNVSHRSQLLVAHCFNTLGEQTSKVYAALLRCLERSIRRCQSDEDDDGEDSDEDEDEYYSERDRQIDEETGKIRGAFVAEIMLELGPQAEPDARVDNTAKRANDTTTRVASKTDPKLNTMGNRLKADVDIHLGSLKAHSLAYPVIIRGEEQWRVDFVALSSLLVRNELEDIITTRLGRSSALIVRTLYEKGKMDERHIASGGLANRTEIRAKLLTMLEAGFLDLQEVPRDASRHPDRTIYLWFFDEAKCRRFALDNTYQMMSRLLQRRLQDRSRKEIKSLLEKASRTDVAGREEQLLNDAEKTALRELERREDQVWVELSRLDDSVAILRDFA